MWGALVALLGVGGIAAGVLYKLGIFDKSKSLADSVLGPTPQTLDPEGKIDDAQIAERTRKDAEAAAVTRAVSEANKETGFPLEKEETPAEAAARYKKMREDNEKLRKEIADNNRMVEQRNREGLDRAEERARQVNIQVREDQKNRDLASVPKF